MLACNRWLGVSARLAVGVARFSTRTWTSQAQPQSTSRNSRGRAKCSACRPAQCCPCFYDTCDSFPVFLQDEEAEKEDATRTSHLTGGVWHPAVLLLQQKSDVDGSPNEIPPTPLAPLSPNAHATVTPPAMATPRAPSDVLLFAGRQGQKAKNR